MKEVVITGLGPVTPWGIGRNNFNFTKSIHDESQLLHSFKEEINNFKTPGRFTYLDRLTRLFLNATSLAINDSGLNEQSDLISQAGISFGSAFGGHELISESSELIFNKGINTVPASMLVFSDNNVGASFPSIVFGMKGPNTMLCTGICSAIQAICFAFHQIKFFRSYCIFAGGGDAYSDWIGKYIDNQKAMEGVGVLCLEDKQQALSRQANILGVIEKVKILNFDKFNSPAEVLDLLVEWADVGEHNKITILVTSGDDNWMEMNIKPLYSRYKMLEFISLNEWSGTAFSVPPILGIMACMIDDSWGKRILHLNFDVLCGTVCAVLTNKEEYYGA